MNGNAARTFQAQEFARLAGITVRTLHHYDRLGLLKPCRTDAGYRLYRECDLERLEQIVALKFIGLPLKQIKSLLDRNPFGMADALRIQRNALEDKRRLLGRAIHAIQQAELALDAGSSPDPAALRKIIEVIEMQNNSDWMMKYYSEDARAKIAERGRSWTPELQAQCEKDWADLFRDVEANLDQDPAGATAQALAARWIKLVEGFTGGDPVVTDGLKELYADRPNWPAELQQKAAPFSNPRVLQFINQAIAIRKSNPG